ncbi:hypothetical protein [Streptomyces thermospinosisporus]
MLDAILRLTRRGGALLASEMALIDIFTGAHAGVPALVRYVFILGAPVSITAVCLWELRRLRIHYGRDLRGLLMR